jgi:hypothetical protein
VYRNKKDQQRHLDMGEIFLIEIDKKIFNLQILASALTRYDACENEKNNLSDHANQMEDVNDDEILKDTEVDIDMEISSNDDNIFNTENFMDTDELELDEDRYAFLASDKR